MSDLVGQLREDAKRYREGTGAGIHEDLDYQWADKPHRHVFDLCHKLEYACSEIASLTAERDKMRELLRQFDHYVPADMADDKLKKITVTWGTLRQVRAALPQDKPQAVE